MLNTIITIFISCILMSICVYTLIYMTSGIMIRSKNIIEANKIILDKDTSKIFFKQLEKMIQYETIYAVDAKCGDMMSRSVGAIVELSNDEINDLYEEIQKTIMTNMSQKMKTYLYDNFGEKWIYDYIRIYTLSMLINYTNLSIESLTLAKK